MKMTEKETENYIVRNVNYFCSPEKQMLFHVPYTKEHSEGKDGEGFSIDGNGGNIEIKAINNFLTRGNDGYEDTGSLPFEVFLWGKTNDIKNAKDRGQNPDFPGWLFAILNPLYYRDAREDEGHTATASTFDKLAFGLRDNKGNLFACIMFDDIPRLRKCLTMLIPPITSGEWDILNLKIPPRSDEAYWRKYWKWNKDTGGMIRNNWHIPFAKILHLATVTMIDDDPEIIPSYTNEYGQCITAEMQEKRLTTLKQLAKYPDGSERRISTKEIAEHDPNGRFIVLSGIKKFDPNNSEHVKASMLAKMHKKHGEA